ncbi:MAG: hypothetical protein H0T57_10195 [Rubrobacter sp.]|nr:hypothetical protein [Rubrobacter sp.]MDQ3638002.1 hypothetical protein [Actinomycetota bacterium]
MREYRNFYEEAMRWRYGWGLRFSRNTRATGSYAMRGCGWRRWARIRSVLLADMARSVDHISNG